MHAQWMEWKKLEFAGLKPIQPSAKIKAILHVDNLGEYVKKMEVYPVFADTFHVTTDSQGKFQFWIPEIPMQMDATYTNVQLFFLNELVTIRVHEMN
jgi:hypothetical protein